MHAEFSSQRNEIVEICRSYGVERLEIFGSTARGADFDPEWSDADFLVEFEPSREPESHFELFDFQNVLAAALRREVDVLMDLPKNKNLRASINCQVHLEVSGSGNVKD